MDGELSDSQVRQFIGARLRRDRVRAHMSQAELGQRLGISFQQVQKYERGSNALSASKLHAIAAIFNKPVESYFPPRTGAVDLQGETALATAAGVRLVHAFACIETDKAREAAVFMVETIAATEKAARDPG